MNIQEEANKIKNSISKICKKSVKEMPEFNACLRVYKAIIVTAPSNNKCGVKLVGSESVLSLPYTSDCSAVSVGDAVLVATTFNSFRNAFLWMPLPIGG